MKTLAGAVLVLAGAILFAAGTIADASLAAANHMGNAGGLALLGGGIVATMGFLLLGIGLIFDSMPRQQG